MTIANSPLRYPGGKAILSKFLAHTITMNNLEDGTYIEPFAGGAGAALNLLFGEYVGHIVLNDADRGLYSFWKSVLIDKDDFLTLVDATEVTIGEWKRQRAVYLDQCNHSRLEVGFACFFLNRCNRSGIIVGGGPIGGIEQGGAWKLDARFNKEELIRRIEKIYAYRDRISVYCCDAIKFLRNYVCSDDDGGRVFVFLDPPYFVNGRELYLNHHRTKDHARLALFVRERLNVKWLMTYDDVPEVRHLYAKSHLFPFQLDYSVSSRKKGNELLIHPDHVRVQYDLLPN